MTAALIHELLESSNYVSYRYRRSYLSPRIEVSYSRKGRPFYRYPCPNQNVDHLSKLIPQTELAHKAPFNKRSQASIHRSDHHAGSLPQLCDPSLLPQNDNHAHKRKISDWASSPQRSAATPDSRHRSSALAHTRTLQLVLYYLKKKL